MAKRARNGAFGGFTDDVDDHVWSCRANGTLGWYLLRLRDLQSRTGGITEFVPLPFVAQEAPIYLKGGARPGPTFREAILMHAVARIALHPLIPNIQASWVKLGPVGVKIALTAGVNDLGGTLMNESITRAAGSIHGQEAPPETLEEWIVQAGRQVRQRTTTYGDAPATQRLASFGAAPLDPLVNTPFREVRENPPRARQWRCLRRRARKSIPFSSEEIRRTLDGRRPVLIVCISTHQQSTGYELRPAPHEGARPVQAVCARMGGLNAVMTICVRFCPIDNRRALLQPS